MPRFSLIFPSGYRVFEVDRLLFYASSLACCCTLLLATNHSAVGQDQHEMPWVSDDGQLMPLGFKERPAAASNDRDAIEIAPVKIVAPAVAANNAQYDWGFLSRPLLICLFVTGVLCIIGLMIWLFLFARLDDGGGALEQKHRSRSLEQSIKQLPFELEASFGDFREQALAAYRAGDLRKSLILLFSHVLVTLDQKNLVHLKKGKTNRQYLRELKPHPQLAGYYGDVMVPFEQTFFGNYPVEKEVCEKCWNDLDQFQADVESIKRGNHD